MLPIQDTKHICNRVTATTIPGLPSGPLISILAKNSTTAATTTATAAAAAAATTKSIGHSQPVPVQNF
jgi:hypothetical protein